VQNVDALLGQTVAVKIIKLNKRRRNIVVSRRAVLEEERDRMMRKAHKEFFRSGIKIRDVFGALGEGVLGK